MKKSALIYSLICFIVSSNFIFAQTCAVPNNIYQNVSDTEFGSTSYDYGQSFTADCNGHIQSIKVFTTEVTASVSGTLNIYAGTPPFTGVNTVAPVYQQAVNWGTSSSETAQTIELTPSFPVVSGTKYTYIITGTVGKVTYQVDQSNIGTGNTYPDGFFMYRNPSTSYWQRDGGRDQKFQIHYTDVIAPPAQCKNATIYLDANGEATLSPLDIDNNTPGGVVSRSISKSSFNCTDLGANTVTLTVNDASLNTDSCDATVTVVDNLSPINTSCPQNIVVNNCGLAPVTYDIPTFTDNCEVVSIVRIAGPESGSIFPINQTTTVTHRATDSSGLTTDCTFTVTPQDLVFPTVTGIPDDQTINLTDTCEGFIAAYTPMVTDNCPGVVTDQTTGISGTGPFPVGTTVNTLTFTDLGGNVTTKSFSVTVIDDTIPTITGVPNDQTINLTDTCEGYISPYTLVLNDNCIGVINQTTGVSGTGPFPVGATTNTFTFTDGGGNTVTESFTVTVIDVAPNAACQDVTVELDVNGLATVSVADINNGSSDNCSIASLSLSAMNFNGTTSNTSPTDELLGNGQTYYINSYSFTPPVTANYEFIFNGTSSDNQGIVMVLWDDVPVRNSGNFQTDRDEYAGFTVRNTGGVFTFGDQSFNLIGGETYYFDITTNTPANTVTYQGDALINSTDLNFNCNIGTFPIELIVEDNAGLTSRCNSTITVTTAALAFETCPSDQTFFTDADVCTNNITFNIPTLANTSCGAIVTQVEGLSSGSDFPIGDTLMKFTATNDFGETAVCEFTFTVEDNQPPTPTSPDNIVVDNSPTGTGVIVNYTTTFLDNCTDVANLNVTYPSGLPSGSEFPVGTTYNKIEAADESGNTSFCSLFVTVNDTFDPVIACQDYTADLNNGATVDVFPIDLDNGSTDNSGNLNFGFLGNSFSGVIDTNSPTDIFEGGGLDTHYVAVYAFQVPQDGQYDFSVSGTTSSSNNDRFLLSLHDQRPLLMTGEGLFDGPGYISNSFRLFNGDGSPNDGPAEFNLIANKTYFVEISSEAFNATANFTFSVNQNIITTEAFLSFDCTDIGTDNQTTLYAFDDGGNIVTCTQTVSVINSTVANAVCQDINLTQAELDANNGKVYPQDIDDGSTGFKAFSTSYIEGTMTTATPIIENVNGDEYYHKKMTFIPENSGTATVTINTNKPLIFVIYDEEQTTINFSQSLTGMPVQSGSTTGLLGSLEEGKVYYGYFVIFTGTDFTTDAEFSMSYDNSSIKSTLAFIEPVDCPTQQELFVFNSCGAIDSCTANITINNCNDTHFITTWNLSDPADLSITIPTASGETYNYEVDWNYDPVNGFNSGGTYTGDATSPSNQYAGTGEYKVAIRGDFPRIFFGGGSGDHKIIDINQWGTNPWTSMFGAFTGCENIDVTAQDTPDLSNADNMHFMFAFSTNLDGSTANWDWDVSTITNMSRVFQETSFIGNASISNWNTSNVLRMVHMFKATSFNQNIGNWDLSSMLQFQMDGMFENVMLSTAVYDAILMGWATDSSTVPGDGIDDIPVNTGFHGGNSRYCAAEDAWNILNTDNSWNIIDGGGCSDSDYFITTWSVENNGTITIPTTGTGYDYQVDWNYNGTTFNSDGITYTDGDTATSFLYSAGTYEIAIFGNFPRIYFNNQGDKDKIIEIKQWGTSVWSSMENAFLGCSNVQLTATDSPDFSSVTSTNHMFSGCQAFTGHDSMNDWEMSTILSMRQMFTSATNFNANINGWNVSNTTDMFGLFLAASTFDQDISGWNVGNVTNMESMFNSASSFNKNIGGWNVALVENMENMFFSAAAFNQEIGGWNVGLVENMRSMFYNASDFDGDISNWNVENVLVMDTMFRNATSFNQDIGNWDVSSVTNMYEMFAGATAFDQNIGAWDISSLNTANGTLGANGMFSGVELSVANYDALLIGWATDTSPGDSVDDIPTGITFSGGNSFYCEGDAARALLIADYGWTIATDDTYLPAYCLTPEEDKFKTTWLLDDTDKSVRIPTTGTGYNYIVNWGDGNTTINHNGDASHNYENAGTYQISISGDFPRIYFEDALNNNDKKIISIDQWGTQVWSTMESAFSYCTNLEMNATDVPNLSQVESMAEMFRECSAALFNPSIGSWDVSNVTSMRRLFIDAYLFDQDINAWNVGNVTNMSYMFNNAQLFNKPLNNWDVSSVTNMEGMFFNAEIFDQNLGDWDISMLSNANNMFKEIALSTENYDALLIGWSTLDTSEGETQIPTGVSFNGGNSVYCDGAAARGILSDPPYNWGISDSGECGFFATTWQTTEANESITIYTSSTDLPSLPDVLEGPFVYDYNIDWGDGQVDLNVTGNVSHTYLTAGDHKVRIEGVFPHMSAGNGGDDISNAAKLKSIDVWGDLEWKSMAYSFTYCSNMELNASDSPDVSQVTNMSAAFAVCYEITDPDLSGWDVSNVENMKYTFLEAVLFTGDITQWDVSSVTDMTLMFSDALQFNGDINGWNVSNVITMEGMFSDANTFNRDLNDWDVTSVKNMEFMFNGETHFNGNISSWDVSGVTSMFGMFSANEGFNQNIGSWDVRSVDNISYMFDGATTFDQNLATWDLSNVLTAENMFTYSGMSVANYDDTLIGWATDSNPIVGVDDIPYDVSLDATSAYCLSASARQNLIVNYNWNIDDGGIDANCETIVFSPKIFLQGAALNPNTGEENLMRDDLRIAGIIPTRSPYADMISCEATVFDTTGNDAIIDWVWVELRDANNNSLVLTAQSALLQRDGDIVSVDGTTALSFDAHTGNYYIAIKHRNHLGIISSSAFALSGMSTTVDFTDAANQITFGTNAQTTFGMAAGKVAMWTGNVNGDSIVQYSGTNPDTPDLLSEVLNDPGNFLNFPTYAVSGYKKYDINMNGNTQYLGTSPDTPIILQNVLAHPGNFLNFSTYQIKEQLPENQ